jgi:hypothetical protein
VFAEVHDLDCVALAVQRIGDIALRGNADRATCVIKHGFREHGVSPAKRYVTIAAVTCMIVAIHAHGKRSYVPVG